MESFVRFNDELIFILCSLEIERLILPFCRITHFLFGFIGVESTVFEKFSFFVWFLQNVLNLF